MNVSRTISPLLLGLSGVLTASYGQVVINEIHYNPVERPAFAADGSPTIDLTDDVHEFLELRNSGASPVSVAGWQLTGGITFSFPNGTSIPAGGYLVVARNPARIQTVYGTSGVLGPYTGKLKNSGDSVRLLNVAGGTVDTVNYESKFPWAISANKLGAEDEFTGLDSLTYQYKGRSLQRVSATASSNDPANWIAVRPVNGPTTFADLPTPGAANIVSRAVPKPVVVAYSALQASDGAVIIRSTAQVTVSCTFSSTESLSNVQVEYFLENMNAFGEARTTLSMTAGANGQFTATLPTQINRSIVRYRIKADRGEGSEVVAPRADDPAVVQVGAPTYQASPPKRFPAPREPWYSYFVTPLRGASPNPIIDVIVPTNGQALDDNGGNVGSFTGINGIQSLSYNCTGSPKRTTAENTSGNPREIPYVLPTDRIWNDVVPGVFVNNGVVRDIVIRFHGSRYNRRPSRKSYKVFFADYNPYTDGAGVPVTQIFETDKGDSFSTGHGLHRAANLPISHVRWVDWYFNGDGLIRRLEQGEYNGELLDAHHERIQRLNPGSVKEETGEYYKSVGFIVGTNTGGEGPYGAGNGWKLPPVGSWTELQRFDYTYALQNHRWKGPRPVRDLVNSMWTARGDTHTSPNPNLTNLRTWMLQNWDVETELTSLALGNWMCPWDDTTQNYFLWRRANGTWARTLWDFDGMYGAGDGTSSTSSIYLGEVANPNNNFRGPNYFKDSFIKAFREEYKARLWFLNNTLLDPSNLDTLTFKDQGGASVTYRSAIAFAVDRFNSVNSQVALGVFYKPTRPTNTTPTNNAAVLPGVNLGSSTYNYKAAYTLGNPPGANSPHTSSKWEIRAETGSYDDPIIAEKSTTALTSLPIPFDQLTYGAKYFWRVTYFDADGHPSITSAETAFSYGPTSLVAGNIVINEVMADNRSAVPNGTTNPDYVELKNNTAAAINVGGWGLTDDELVPGRYLIPAGTMIAAGSYLVLWCDSETAAPGLHTGFALKATGQRVILTQGGTVRDAIAFGPQAPNLSIGRVTDGTGAWTLTNPTAGATNTSAVFGTSAATIKINEWLADPVTGSDWFELYNPETTPIALAGLWLSDLPGTPKTTQIPALSFIGADGFARFDADGTTAGFNSVNFKLGAGGDTILLSTSNGATTLASVTFGVQTIGVSQGRFTNGSATIVAFPNSASPGSSNWLPAPVVINEALTNSASPFEDAIEIFNPTGSPVSIGGWWLSDDGSNLQKFQIPAGTNVPAGGYVVFYELQFNPTPGAGSSFSLSSLGDEIYLSAVDGGSALTGYRAQVRFGAAAENVSFGRIPVAGGGSEFWPQTVHTFGQDNANSVAQFRTGTGALNGPPRIGPVIINELMYHPVDLAGLDNARDELVELHNISTTAVDLSGWRLKGDSDFTFSAGTSLRPGDYVLVVSFDPADTSTLNAFRAQYGLPVSVPVYGPFTPKLSNSSQSVELAYPGPLVNGQTPFINIDKVEYADVAPWPVAADGTGVSLQRISRTAIGNDASNWSAAAPTPGNVNSGQSAIADNDGDGLPNTWEDANGLDKFSAADVALDLDGDGLSNGSEFAAGTSPQDPSSVLRATVTKIAGGFQISFPQVAGKTYSIFHRADLVAGTWMKLVDVPASGSSQTFIHTDNTSATQRFYRVTTPQSP